ncbi:PaaI family thioesterase [Jeotgalibacillus sp. R-1-5s-1]|uniref:PaaI family thioesterase n=1 Tax=Jeotgalibacillus sp. R-1-5s-1 TaxID=2555897 RepID=UPI001068F641|nr:PaaI family thioesterase [Jeotgalibacillus sp. R-1-5s-1]TFE03607.1 PaaI family thioesterase [Jeotgalibacillus sp. R-1-5s-1]
MNHTDNKSVTSFYEHASEEERQIIEQVVKGLADKREGRFTSNVSALFNLEADNGEELLTLHMPVTPMLYNSLGIVHGGVTATAIDTAMGTLANRTVPEGFGAVTSQLTIHYTAPVSGTEVTAHARIIHRGSKTMVLEGWLTGSDQKRMAHATASFFLIPKK